MTAVVSSGVGYAPDRTLLDGVLRPYRDTARYLREASVQSGAGAVQAHGRFAVGESCYIDDTGHFNAVEFNICYNQLGYYLFASCVRDTLFPCFGTWTMADYWPRQLANMLIYDFGSHFRRQIDPRRFEGVVTFREPVLRERPGRAPLWFMDTSCAFWDDRGGSADGEVRVAITNLPAGV